MSLCYTPREVFGPTLAQELDALADAFKERLFFAGGTARDLLLGRGPQEVDLSIQAEPEEIAVVLGNKVEKIAPQGVFVYQVDGVTIEIAAQREESHYEDSRRPSRVRFAGLEEDAQRRDFTVNALYLCVKTGEVVDLVGGMADLREGVLKVVGDPERLLEDAVRPLRLVRFAARLGFEVDPALLALAQHFVLHGGLEPLSPQRIFTELTAILCGGNAHIGFDLLGELGIWEKVIPEVWAMRHTPQSHSFHPEGNVWRHNWFLLRALGPCEPAIAWATLLHDVAKPRTLEWHGDRTSFHGHPALGEKMATEILERFKAPRKLIQEVGALVHDHLLPMDADRMRPSKFKKYLENPLMEGHLNLHLLDSLASDSGVETLSLLRHRWLNPATREEHPPLPIRGQELLAAGIPPGPEIGRLLALATKLHEEKGPFSAADLLAELWKTEGKNSY